MSCDEDEALWFKFSRSFKPSTDSTVRRRRTWRVLLVHHDHEDLNIDDGDGNRGIILPGSNRILIDASRSVRVIQATALHEIAHAVLYDAWPADVPETKAKIDLEEAIVHSLDHSLNRIARPQWPPCPPDAQAIIKSARKKRPRR